MVRKKTLRTLLRYVLPALVLLTGVVFVLWAYEATVLMVYLRRPGTTDLMAKTLAYHYEGDTYVAGWICIASALGWWLMPWRM